MCMCRQKHDKHADLRPALDKTGALQVSFAAAAAEGLSPGSWGYVVDVLCSQALLQQEDLGVWSFSSC